MSDAIRSHTSRYGQARGARLMTGARGSTLAWMRPFRLLERGLAELVAEHFNLAARLARGYGRARQKPPRPTRPSK